MRELDSIIKEYFIEEGKGGQHQYPRYLQIATAGLKDLNWDVSGTPMVQKMSKSDNGTIPFPEDMVKLVRIYFVADNGKLVQVFNNQDLSPLQGCDEVNENNLNIPQNSYTNTLSFQGSYAKHHRNTEQIGRYYGARGGGVYEFRTNWEEFRWEFPSGVPSELYVEYLGNPKKVNGKFIVHPWLVEPIKAYIQWKKILRKDYKGVGEKDYFKREYYREKHNALVRFATEGIGEIINSSRKTKSLTAKY